jgi:hypothetical protein
MNTIKLKINEAYCKTLRYGAQFLLESTVRVAD